MRALLFAVTLSCTFAVAGPKRRSAPVAVAPAQPAAEPVSTTPYVAVQPAKAEGLEPELAARANTLLKAALDKYQLEYAPEGETEAQAAEAVKAKRTKGLQLHLTLTPSGGAMKASLMVTKWPGGGLLGSWYLDAEGAAPSELVEALLPQCVADAAGDLAWQKRD